MATSTSIRLKKRDLETIKAILATRPDLDRNASGAIRVALEEWRANHMEEEVKQMSDLREQAQARVDSDPRLVAHESVIMYDWAEGDEHWQRVISAPVAEIVDWAETVEKE